MAMVNGTTGSFKQAVHDKLVAYQEQNSGVRVVDSDRYFRSWAFQSERTAAFDKVVKMGYMPDGSFCAVVHENGHVSAEPLQSMGQLDKILKGSQKALIVKEMDFHHLAADLNTAYKDGSIIPTEFAASSVMYHDL